MIKRSLLFLAICCLAISACGPTGKSKSPQSATQMRGSGQMVAAPETVPSRGVITPGTTPVKIALLVPLSGESAAVGKAMMDAANMALYDSYLSVPSSQIRSQLVLLPKDTGSTPADAARVTQQALSQGAKFIIGPLFSQSVAQVQPIIQSSGVSMLTFSNTKEIARTNTFLFGFMPEQQVQRMADYAFLNGYSRVALLAPNDGYGQRIQETLVGAYSRKGGLVKPIEQYAPSPTNIDAAVGRIAAFNDSNQDQAFQAIFIADGGYQLNNIIASIKKTNLDLSKIKLLGTGLWDDPEIAKIPEMNGAWFSSSPPYIARSFEQRFEVLYGYKPIRLASLAYDAVCLLAKLTMPHESGEVDLAAMTTEDGFMSPANGLVRLKPDGLNERKLAILEITSSGFKVIDMAPDSFKTPGEVLP